MPPATDTISTIGELLLAAPAPDSPEQPAWLLAALERAPDAWLTLHSVERRVDPGSGHEYACFIAPTLSHFAETADVPENLRPQVFTLRDLAAPLIADGLGVVIYAPLSDISESLTFTLGDLVQLHLEGSFKISPTAEQWAALYTPESDDEPPFSLFFADPNNPDSIPPFETADAPPEVIPPALGKTLKAYLRKEIPKVEFPILARSGATGLLSLVFFAPTIADVAAARDVVQSLGFFFPSHYHLMCIPRRES